jgi:hypothetical protein
VTYRLELRGNEGCRIVSAWTPASEVERGRRVPPFKSFDAALAYDAVISWNRHARRAARAQ